MKKINSIILLFLLICTILTSCLSSEMSDDHEAPKMSDIKLNINDTIIEKIIEREVDGKIVKDTISHFYNRILGNTEILVKGHPIILSGTFTDNKALSAAFIHIWGDTLKGEQGDITQDVIIGGELIKDQPTTCYRLKTVVSTIYGNTEISLGGTVLETQLPNTKTDRNGKEAIIREDDEYKYDVHCLDLAGNEVSLSGGRVIDGVEPPNYKPLKVLIKTRIEVLKMLGIEVDTPKPKE